MRLLALVVLFAVAVPPARSGSTRTDRVELVPLAAKRLALCRKSVLLRPACRRLVPRVRAAYLAHLATELTRPHPLAVFDLERGGEYPTAPERNRPPRMAHLVMVAGEVWRAAPVWTIGTRKTRLRNGLMRRARSQTFSFGAVHWAGRDGRLYLAPS